MSDIFGRVSDFMRDLFNGDDIFSDRPSSDPDLQEAWQELEQFLSTGTTDSKTGNSGGKSQYQTGSGYSSARQNQQEMHSHLTELKKDYQTLEVPFLAHIDTVRTSYKRLLRAYHPDRFSNDPDKLQVATEVSSRITSAFTRIKEFEKRRGHTIK